MHHFRIGLAVGDGLRIAPTQAVSMIAALGFDDVFLGYRNPIDVRALAELAFRHGLGVSSLHAPFHRIDSLWFEGAEGDARLAEQLACIDLCLEYAIPIAVVHPWIGFENLSQQPTACGLSRFTQLVEYAADKGVKIALENVEGEALLSGLLSHFADHPAVGFCLDCGHELCYNKGRDLLAEYGDRLIYTHINSNMGVTAQDGSIFWHDDSHMLPYDGLVDMDGLAKRLKKCAYQGPLMLELTRGNKGDRHTNDRYLAMTDEEYLQAAYERICRLRSAVEGISPSAEG